MYLEFIFIHLSLWLPMQDEDRSRLHHVQADDNCKPFHTFSLFNPSHMWPFGYSRYNLYPLSVL